METVDRRERNCGEEKASIESVCAQWDSCMDRSKAHRKSCGRQVAPKDNLMRKRETNSEVDRIKKKVEKNHSAAKFTSDASTIDSYFYLYK